MNSALTENFEIYSEQNAAFISYLKEQILEVRVWDAITNDEFGVGKIKLARALR